MTEQRNEQELLERLREVNVQDRGVAYAEPRIFATIHVDRWWITLRGVEEPIEKRDVLDGVIPAGRILRTLYRKEVTAPLCTSWDGGVTGNVNPEFEKVLPIHTGQSCASCPFNQWGSAANWEGGNGADDAAEAKRGKACKERRGLVMMVSGITDPVIVRLPTSSIGIWDAFANAMALKGDSYLAHRVRIGIKGMTKGTNNYGVAQFTAYERLPNEQIFEMLEARSSAQLLLAAKSVVEAEPEDGNSQPTTGSGAGASDNESWDGQWSAGIDNEPLSKEPF